MIKRIAGCFGFKKYFRITLSLYVLCAVLSPFLLKAEDVPAAPPVNPPNFSAEDVSNRIEARRGSWITLRAQTSLDFQIAGEHKAACQGTLLYHRLDEALKLECYDDQRRLLFVFKTEDRDFELYLPAHKSLYRGNIFSLENSPSIESHLRAWDLYRALKPAFIPAENVTVDQAEDGKITMRILRQDETAARVLKVTNQGEVLSETYYSPEGNPSVEITRNDFQKIVPAPASPVEPAFAHKISITAFRQTSEGSEARTTQLSFQNLDFSSSLEDKDFQFAAPEDAHIVELEEQSESGQES